MKIPVYLDSKDWAWLVEFLDQTLREVEDMETTEEIYKLQTILIDVLKN